MITKAPRGTRDLLPKEIVQWHYFEEKVREVCRLFGYQEIRTPIFEHTELFLRGVGEVTDIVSKEMYTFMDRGERSLTLRPEGTAAVARAYLENKMHGEAQPIKLYYVGPMFRYDRPQAGRYRQFHQFGVEVFGSQAAELDAEVITLSLFFFRALGLNDFTLHINSVGCPQCRQEYRRQLQAALQDKVSALCADCAERFAKNPLRILDCKQNKCRELTQDVPSMLDVLCGECAEHFAQLRQTLDELGENYVVNPRLVRGLDYYTKTAFEIISPALGAQSSICGGGRYDYLLNTIGGPQIPGIGFAVGIERVLLALEAAGVQLGEPDKPEVFVATAKVAPKEALKLTMDLRQAGLAAEQDFLNRSLKAQLKYADKKGIKLVVILGEKEMQKGQVTVREMQTGSQETVTINELATHLAALVRRKDK